MPLARAFSQWKHIALTLRSEFQKTELEDRVEELEERAEEQRNGREAAEKAAKEANAKVGFEFRVQVV